MPPNGGFVALKQFCNLVGGKPHGIIDGRDLYFCLPVLGLVEEVTFGKILLTHIQASNCFL